MKMIAISTVHGHKLIKPRDTADPKSKNKYEDIVVKPGEEFETTDLGIDDDEAKRLVETGAARRKTKEVADDSEGAPVRGHRGAHRGSAGKIDLSHKTDEELRALAASRSVTIAADASREQIIAALQAKV